jgi:hypothetical protein
MGPPAKRLFRGNLESQVRILFSPPRASYEKKACLRTSDGLFSCLSDVRILSSCCLELITMLSHLQSGHFQNQFESRLRSKLDWTRTLFKKTPGEISSAFFVGIVCASLLSHARFLAGRSLQKQHLLCLITAQTGFTCPDSSLRSVNNLKLTENIGDMVTYRLHADDQSFGDFGVGLSIGDER